MSRTIIYERRVHGAAAADERQRYAGRGTGSGENAEVVRPGDSFGVKLVKYIPGEALALVALIGSISGITRDQVLAVVIVAGVGQILWLNQSASRLESDDRPTVRQYAFAVIAYAGWVLGTTPKVVEVLGWSRTTGTIVMASIAYLLPLVDDHAHEWLDRAAEEPILAR